MVDEAPDARLAETGDSLHEVDPFADGRVWVVVDTLGRSSGAQHVRQKGRVTSLLVGHELDQRTSLRSKSSCCELCVAEACKTIVEEIKLDPLLVETKCDAFEVEVALDHVSWKSAICSKPACWCVRRWERVQWYTQGVVVCCGWIRWQCRN